MSEITKTKDQRPKTKDQFIWLLFAIIIIAVYFCGLNIPLLGPDEPRYSQVAREMFERGDWITPKLGGFDWFEKPALLYWLQIASYNLFGVNEFAARFGSSLFGLGTILSLWILGRRWSIVSSQWTASEGNSAFSLQPSSFANWLGLIAASSIGLIAFSHAASFDIILTFPITASLVGFFLFDQAKEKSGFTFYFCLFTFYFFIGVALIAKGLVGIVFPFAIVAFYQVLSWKLPSKIFVISLFWGTVLSLLVACFWYLPMYQVNGWKFIDEFFIQHHFQRYTSNRYQHPQPFYFFFWVLPLMTIPWLPFFFASIWNFFRVKRRKSEAISQKRLLFLPLAASPHLLFAFAWLLVPLIFFSVSGSKLPGYILPSLPAALIVTADYVFGFVRKSAKRRYALQALAFLTFVTTVIILQFFFTKYENYETVKDLISVADKNGYSKVRILNFHTISHNLEFYGAGRLIRTEDGKLKKFEGVGEIIDDFEIAGSDFLVVTPLKYVNQLTENEQITAKVLSDNGELAIVAVKLK